MGTTRRFYFDDGKSRKRWQITQSGKAVATQFGRLSGSLRVSTKVAQSPAQAQKFFDQLVSEKLREGYIEVDPSRLEVVRTKGIRSANEKQVSELEQSLGCKLPPEYRNFLLSTNGGRPNPDCVKVPGVPYIDNVGVGTLFHLQPSKPGMDEITYEVERTKELLPKGHLPIGGSSDLFTISLSAKTSGAVYWWNHESEDLDDDGNFLASAAYLLASSFDEFLTRIACLFDKDEDEEAEDEAEDVPIEKASGKTGSKAAGKTSGSKSSSSKRLARNGLRRSRRKAKQLENADYELCDFLNPPHAVYLLSGDTWLPNPPVLGSLKLIAFR